MSHLYTKIGPNSFLKEEIEDSELTANADSSLIRNVPPHETPLFLPVMNFKKNQEKSPNPVSNKKGEEEPLPLPRMF